MIFGHAADAGVVACGKANPTDKNTRRMAHFAAPLAQELPARSVLSMAARQKTRGLAPSFRESLAVNGAPAREEVAAMLSISDAATPLKPARLAGWAFPAGINGMALRAASVRSDGASPSKS